MYIWSKQIFIKLEYNRYFVTVNREVCEKEISFVIHSFWLVVR